MKRLTAFGLLVVPALGWIPVRAWLYAQAATWSPGQGELSLGKRVLMLIDSSLVRYFPFVMIGVWVLMPLLAYGASRLESGPAPGTRKALLVWTMLAFAFAAGLTASTVLSPLEMWWYIPQLWWAVTACYALAMGAAYVVQQERWLRGTTKWSPGSVLWCSGGLLVLTGGMAPVLPALVWLAASRDAYKGAPQNNRMQLTRSTQSLVTSNSGHEPAARGPRS